MERLELVDPEHAQPSNAGTSTQVLGVSCSAASACTAFGTYNNSSGAAVTLAERYS